MAATICSTGCMCRGQKMFCLPPQLLGYGKTRVSTMPGMVHESLLDGGVQECRGDASEGSHIQGKSGPRWRR